MARRMIWAAGKIHSLSGRKAACSQCEWVSEMRHYGRKGKHPANTAAVRLEFLGHNCEEFPAGARRWSLGQKTKGE